MLDVRYAMNGDVAIAYALLGDGAVDVVYVAPLSNLEIMFDNPLYARFLRRLSRLGRLIVVDRRGAGLSDGYSADDLPPLEDLVTDLSAVLDTAGSERPVLFGSSDAGLLCAMFAATYPERVSGLVLYATAARGTQAPDYPWQWSEAEWSEYLAEVRAGWGTSDYGARNLELFAPSAAIDERLVEWNCRFLRLAASPGAIYAQERLFREMDVRALLPAISVPTLVLHRADDAIEPVGAGRYLAEAIAGSTYVELPGADHLPWAGDQEALLAEVERFVAMLRTEEEIASSRVLATVLFTDIVDSTLQAAALGDRGWSELRDLHDRVVRSQLARFRGREVKTVGDGFIATFEGPARAVRCARAIVESVATLGMEVRAGVHTGEIELDGDDITGIAVSIGARVGALARGGEVLVSSTVKDLVVGSGLVFADRGEQALKGVPGVWRLFVAEGE